MSLEEIKILPDEKISHEAFYDAFCETVLGGLLEEHERQGQQTLNDLQETIEGLSEDKFPDAPKEKM